jgi:hypothetical protein
MTSPYLLYWLSNRIFWGVPSGAFVAPFQDDNRRGLLESQGISDSAMTVFVYVNTSKPVGDPEHIKVFATTRRRGKPSSSKTILKA